jgi:hypothetical protein
MKANELLTYIFGGSAHSFAGPFGAWLKASPAFQTFAETYRSKIHRKVQGLRDEETQRDLLAELAVAYWLLQERRFTVEYELYSADKQRGPDFTVTFRTRVRFNVEVTRLRITPAPEPVDPAADQAKILNTICAKLGQMPPSIINVLVLVADPNMVEAEAVAAAIRLLADRAAHKDDAFFARRGFISARDFQRQYARLSAILFRPLSLGTAPTSATLWPNAQARHPLPTDIAAVLQR